MSERFSVGTRGQAIVIGLASLLWAAALGRPVGAEEGQEAVGEGQEARSGPTRYTLKQGDRLVHLAKQFDVEVDAILEANKLKTARGLRSGQEILIPAPGTKARGTVARGPQRYLLRKGDHLVNVARRYNISVDDILQANSLDSPRGVQAGQMIVIPAPGEAAETRQALERESRRSGEEKSQGAVKRGAVKRGAASEPRWMQKAKRLAESLGLGDRHVAHRILRGSLEPRWVRAAGKGRAPAALRLPVPGGFIGRGWGSGAGGYHLAVDIPGPLGTRVNAAAPGIVAYAGDELAGFGKMVLIIHPGGLVTLYAHNSELKTLPGERVRQGTRVALLGSTGISRGPHVHFELIYEGELCDPTPLLRPQARSKSGRPLLNKGELVSWPRRGGPPKSLRCAKRRRHPEYVGKPYGWRPADWATRYRKKVGGGRDDEPDDDEDEPHPDPDLTEPEE